MFRLKETTEQNKWKKKNPAYYMIKDKDKSLKASTGGKIGNR